MIGILNANLTGCLSKPLDTDTLSENIRRLCACAAVKLKSQLSGFGVGEEKIDEDSWAPLATSIRNFQLPNISFSHLRLVVLTVQFAVFWIPRIIDSKVSSLQKCNLPKPKISLCTTTRLLLALSTTGLSNPTNFAMSVTDYTLLSWREHGRYSAEIGMLERVRWKFGHVLVCEHLVTEHPVTQRVTIEDKWRGCRLQKGNLEGSNIFKGLHERIKNAVNGIE
jgi:hypothetical protein